MSSQKVPQMSGMSQVVMQVPTEDELNAVADTPMDNGRSFSVGSEISANRALADNELIRLSKSQKLRMAHQGLVEIEQEWIAEDQYKEVVEGSSTVWKYVAAETRPQTKMANTDDGIVITDPGTFTKSEGYVDSENIIPFESYQYDGNASSSSVNDGLVGPEYPAITSEYTQSIIIDMPGRTGGVDQDKDNYLSLPGRPVNTDDTYVAALAVINAYAVASDASAMTIAELEDAGVPINNLLTAKLANYKVAVAAETSIEDIEALQQLIVDVNNV